MDTLFGEIPEEALRKVVTEEQVPCGTCITTTYYLGEELARQDCNIVVKEGFSSQSITGEV